MFIVFSLYCNMASSGTNVVVWEWEFTPNLWLPYEIEAVHLIEDSYRSQKQRIKLAGSLACYEIDLKNMTQTRKDTGTLRQVRRSVYPTDSVPGNGTISWEWYSEFGWVPYDISTATVLEKASEEDCTVVDLSKTQLAIPNTVDLKNMEQWNHRTRYHRQIRRTILSKQYPPDFSVHAKNSVSKLLRNLSRHLSTGKTTVAPDVGLPVSANVVSSSSASSSSSSSSSSYAHSNSSALSTMSPCAPLLFSSTGADPQSGASLGSANPTSTVLPTSRTYSKGIKKRKTKHSTGTDVSADPLSKFCSGVQTSSDEECCICYDKLSAPSNFEDAESDDSPHDIKQLNKCKHLFHSSCLRAMYNSGTKDGSLQCPLCKTIHGVKHGTQPSTGTMHVTQSQRPSLPGHPDCGIITITYDFTPGKQGPEHPNTGKHFQARGFPRVCYLPDSCKGRKVLRLLKIAWERRLIFTVGASNTTGQQDTVVWNEIHHKTEAFSNHSGHGYPDPNYLDNALAELAAHGVEDDRVNLTVNLTNDDMHKD